GQRRQRGRIQPRNICHVSEINEFGKISILYSVFGAHVLMLMLIIFVGLSKAHGGKTPLKKGLMIAATSVSIATINHPDFHCRNVALSNFFYKARKLA